MALDDWRVTETWRHVNGKLVHASSNIRTESLILWRRLAGGLSRGQQLAIADPLLAAVRSMVKKMTGQKVKNTTVLLRPEESVEVWRLLGSLEWLPVDTKLEIGNLISAVVDKPKLASARDAMIWAWGRLGQRVPVYGPLNSVLSPQQALAWLERILAYDDVLPMHQLAVVQIARKNRKPLSGPG